MNAFYVSSEDKSKIRIKEPLGINPFKQNQKPGSPLTLLCVNPLVRDSSSPWLIQMPIETHTGWLTHRVFVTCSM